ncbi:MAG TPA: amidohydrolase family protein [Ktedonobacteraceae bacterium]
MRQAFLAARVFDGTIGDYRTNAALLVEDTHITGLVPQEQVPADYGVVDLGSLTLLPGLIDCHVHLVWNGSADPNALLLRESHEKTAVRALLHAFEELMHGVTTVRDVGGLYQVTLAVRDAVREQIFPGPRILAAGMPIQMTGGHARNLGLEVDGPHEARKGVRTMLRAGVDLIKLMASGGVYTEGEEPGSPQLTIEEMQAAVEEAHKAGRKVAAHAEGLQGILNALAAGVDTIEHGNFLDEEAAQRMLAGGQVLVPTLSPFYRMAQLGTEGGIPEYAARKARQVVAASFHAVEMARAGGIPIAAGTDDGSPMLPHGVLVYELELLVRAGLSPQEALHAATTVAAQACGLADQVGTLEQGRSADFIGIMGDPLQDISTLRNIDTVGIQGRLVKRHGTPLLQRSSISNVQL